jgi:hypothetical protein
MPFGMSLLTSNYFLLHWSWVNRTDLRLVHRTLRATTRHVALLDYIPIIPYSQKMSRVLSAP